MPAYHQCLLTKDGVACDFSRNDEEDIDHVLWQCFVVKSAWLMLVKENRVIRQWSYQSGLWLTCSSAYFSKTTDEWDLLFGFFLCWNLWLRNNKIIFYPYFVNTIGLLERSVGMRDDAIRAIARDKIPPGENRQHINMLIQLKRLIAS